MSPQAKLTPGSPCWFELATSDQNAAKQFYHSVFGWSVHDQPMGPSEVYTIFRIDGADAAAAYTMRPEQRAQGVPPNWMMYVLVQDADKTAARAKKLGGTVHAEPFEVMEAGRMSVLQDPTGAFFCIWQARTQGGTGVTDVHGTVVWVDLNTLDQARAGKFYSDLFGWKITDGKNMKPPTPGGYYHIVHGQDFIGGIPPPRGDSKAPPSWLLYFDVADVDETIAKVTANGGSVVMPTMTMETVRRFAVLADGQGAVFAIVQELGGEEKPGNLPVAEMRARPAAKKKPAKAKAAKARPVKRAKKAPVKKAKAKPKMKASKSKPRKVGKAKARTTAKGRRKK